MGDDKLTFGWIWINDSMKSNDLPLMLWMSAGDSALPPLLFLFSSVGVMTTSGLQIQERGEGKRDTDSEAVGHGFCMWIQSFGLKFDLN